jgi:excisionase family DNA binding protein
MPNNTKIQPMLTVGEVAKLVYVHENTVRRWSDQGKLKALRIGPRSDRRFRQDDIGRFIIEYGTRL